MLVEKNVLELNVYTTQLSSEHPIWLPGTGQDPIETYYDSLIAHHQIPLRRTQWRRAGGPGEGGGESRQGRW